MEDKDKRRSLTIRWQPSASSSLANVVDWLKSMNVRDRRDKVGNMCLMTFLPYAKEANKETEEEIERCYWEVHERLQEHLFSMRQTLGIKQRVPFDSYSQITTNVDRTDSSDSTEAQNELEKASLSEMDSIFGA